MIELLAQTSQPTAEQGPSWAFWVTGISLPLFLVAIGQIIWRLRRGEEKFDAQGIAIATLTANVKQLQETCKTLSAQLEQFTQRVNDGSVENASNLGELKAAIAREYTRREQFDEERRRSDERFMDLLNLIGERTRATT